ncbi:MAG: caspase family protein, partial [Mucilaginibacter sp.]
VMISSVKGMAECLSNLGQNYSFSLLGKNRYFTNPSYKIVRDTIEELKPEIEDILLIYYYGHAEIVFKDLCLLAYSDLSHSKQELNPIARENCTLQNLVKCAGGQDFKKVIVIMDSCHSGHAATGLGSLVDKWCLFSSTGDSIQYETPKSNPFTESIISILSNEDLREVAASPGDDALTIKALADKVKSNISDINGLDPRLIGNFSEFKFAPVKLSIQVPINNSAPYNSIYRKLFIIGSLFNSREAKEHRLSLGTLRELLKHDPTFFVTDRSGKKVLISDGTLRDYMHIGSLLELWREINDDVWIRVDKNEIDQEGSLFNKLIVSGVFRLLPEGMDESTIRRFVRDILHTYNEPTFWRIDKMILDKYGPWQHDLEPKYKKIMFRLLGYSKVLKLASIDTFFPR